ncbi:MAG: Glycine/D-amino acid oxidases (deaminating) [uncultured Paraburkholderia sp.]|uniref:NAD(P)/FAD-dependent oxidoreductase n=1 Tax=uncultured Paraburkholderia sp. TaxID=1822466 RepID=UPI00259738A1|nr:FAD-binding oxidoreductase [uncultured Paraburkholderia sp.]CAH2903780.1 MAG: Glycine/D-amino acid oxidases (deaminating) [uncultured Paraburkholderia sp.]CAH2941486.1 MAG: Glycine/D-amino acid oxidases (deaminating) [uncultured Paraburkholderia sp.]
MLEAEPRLDAAAPLVTSVEADVVVVGGGFVGLWTALTIREISPASKVVVLERDVCGGGASGRNGGFVMSWWPKIASLLGFMDAEQALSLAHASECAIQELGDFCEQNSIDAHFRRAGWLWTSTSEAQGNAWTATVEACSKLGVSPFERVATDEVARRTGSSIHRAAVLERSNATVQPAALVRGMRKVALKRGIQIYEKTSVLEVSQDYPSIVRTETGQVRARAVVLATNAWATAIPEIARLIVPVNSSIIVTEPIPERLRSIGWTGGEAITDSQLMVDYYRTTRDGRIAFGKGTGALSRGGVIDGTFSYHADSCSMTERDFRRTYPMLADVRLTHAWSGPIDRTYDSLPVFGTLSGTNHIHYGVGWSGNGVGPSRIGGKILASLALGKKDEWSTCALVARRARTFPPEPIKYLGGSLVRGAVRRKECREAEGAVPSMFDVTLAKLAPSGLEDKA